MVRWFGGGGALEQQKEPQGFYDGLAKACMNSFKNDETKKYNKNKNEKSLVDPTIAETISKDVPRSFGTALRDFDSNESRENLTEVLLAFAVYDPEIGYTQGMNFICAIALTEMTKEQTFFFLIHITKSLPRSFFQRTALDEVELFVEIVQNHAPIIKQHIETSSHDSDGESLHRAIGYLLVQWMVPLFVHALPLETVLGVWDFLFQNEQEEEELIIKLHRVAFAIVEIHSGPILSKHMAISEACQDVMNAMQMDGVVVDDETKLAYEKLLTKKEETSGFAFVQLLLESASKDKNVNRIVHLAREVTIEPKWLSNERWRKVVERESANSEKLDENVNKRDNDEKLSTNEFFECVGVRQKKKWKEEAKYLNSLNDNESDDCNFM